jgi:hypothetical protein
MKESQSLLPIIYITKIKQEFQKKVFSAAQIILLYGSIYTYQEELNSNA